MESQLPDIAEQDSPIKKVISTTLESAMKSGSTTSTLTRTLRVSQAPRIDISRASSSSQHDDSRGDSSPENVFDQVGTGTLQDSNDENATDFGFGEYGTNDLRSSTEELYYDGNDKTKEKPVQEKEFQTVNEIFEITTT